MNAYDENGNPIGGWGRSPVRWGVVDALVGAPVDQLEQIAYTYQPTPDEFDAAQTLMAASAAVDEGRLAHAIDEIVSVWAEWIDRNL